MKFYVTAEEFEDEPERNADRKSGGFYDQIWTVSTKEDESGWNTDCGYPGYGLTYKQAAFIADAANEWLAQGHVWPSGDLKSAD